MASPAHSIIPHLQVAAAAFAEGFDVLAEAEGMSREDRKPGLAYGNQVLTTGFAQLEAAAKLYARLPEASGEVARPVLSDPSFRAAVMACAAQLETEKARNNIAAKRLARALREFVEGEDPTKAHTIAGLADAAARTAKMAAGRAA